jgi:hypothetical protein
MSSKNTNTLALEGVPDIACPIVITAEKKSSRNGKCNRGDSAKDVIVGVGVQFAVGADIEETTAGIVRACTKGISVREEAV